MKCKKNNELVPQIFLAVVGVILVGIIIYYVFDYVKSTKRLTDKILEKTNKTAIEIEENDLMIYDGEEIQGSEVVNLIKRKLGSYEETEEAPIFIRVITKKSGNTYTQTYINKKHIPDIKNYSVEAHYIKPTAMFIGNVLRDENKKIIGVEFTQK